MKDIIFEGNPKSNRQHIFKCRYCNTIFKTDEYEYYKYGAFGSPIYITICPVCNKEKAYTETDLRGAIVSFTLKQTQVNDAEYIKDGDINGKD